MPGLPFHHNFSNADDPAFDPIQAPFSFRVPQTFTFELKRMPLHHIAAATHFHGANSILPANVNDNQSTLLADDKHFTIDSEGPVEPFAHPTHGSAESEHDLAAMVHDFMENGNSYGSDFPESSDGENGLPNCPLLFDTLQALKYNVTPVEKELLLILSTFCLSIKEMDMFCPKSGVECKGACIRRMLVKQLRVVDFDAAICSSKWSNSGKVPGGEYEYIDVFVKGKKGLIERIIVDVDFQSQFEIARPTHSYVAALKFLPVAFVGSEEKLGQVLQVMAEAARLSLKQNSMPLPPWRTLDYMNAKWMSPCERSANESQDSFCSGQGSSQWREHTRTKQCVEQLRHLKLCMAAETEKNHMSKPVNLERNRVMYYAKTRRLSTGSAFLERNHLLKLSAFEKPE